MAEGGADIDYNVGNVCPECVELRAKLVRGYTALQECGGESSIERNFMSDLGRGI